MPARGTIEFVRSRASTMPDAMLEMGLHRAIRAGAMRADRAVTFRASQLSLSVACERLVYRDGVPSLVGP